MYGFAFCRLPGPPRRLLFKRQGRKILVDENLDGRFDPGERQLSKGQETIALRLPLQGLPSNYTIIVNARTTPIEGHDPPATAAGMISLSPGTGLRCRFSGLEITFVDTDLNGSFFDPGRDAYFLSTAGPGRPGRADGGQLVTLGRVILLDGRYYTYRAMPRRRSVAFHPQRVEPVRLRVAPPGPGPELRLECYTPELGRNTTFRIPERNDHSDPEGPPGQVFLPGVHLLKSLILSRDCFPTRPRVIAPMSVVLRPEGPEPVVIKLKPGDNLLSIKWPDQLEVTGFVRRGRLYVSRVGLTLQLGPGLGVVPFTCARSRTHDPGSNLSLAPVAAGKLGRPRHQVSQTRPRRSDYYFDLPLPEGMGSHPKDGLVITLPLPSGRHLQGWIPWARLKRTPPSASWYLARARQLDWDKDHAAIRTLLDQACRAHPGDPSLNIALAGLLTRVPNPQGADLRQARQLAMDRLDRVSRHGGFNHPLARYGPLEVLLQAALKGGDLKEAAQWAGKILCIHPMDSRAWKVLQQYHSSVKEPHHGR